jgi:hypothetical protein
MAHVSSDRAVERLASGGELRNRGRPALMGIAYQGGWSK